MWKNFLYYSKQERRAILLLLFVLLVLLGVYAWLTFSGKQGNVIVVESNAEIDSFLAHLEVVEKERKVFPKHQRKGTGTASTVVLNDFDPNTADSATLRQLGLSAFVTANILKYREKGGVFRTPESFAKIYGMTDEQAQTLLPYINIGVEYLSRDTVRLATAESRDSLARPVKFPEGTVIELNSCDSTELEKVPGIGSGISRMIVAYRNRLGGFHSVNQLLEVSHVDSTMLRWFTVSPDFELRKLEVNKAGIDRLRNHPYMAFYKAKVIIEHRRKRGKFRSINELAMYTEFSDEDISRLKPYLSLE